MVRNQQRSTSLVQYSFVILCIISISFNIVLGVREWNRNVVVSVTDGDTLTLADGRRIRLLGVDTPEAGRCMSSQAKDRLSQLVLGKHIRLKDVVYDAYGRMVANVLVDLQPLDRWMVYMYHRFIQRDYYKNLVMINRVMVEEGLGLYHNSGGQYTQVLMDANRVARTGRLGIFSELCTPSHAQPAGCVIKGNIRNGKKTYFLPDCTNYDDVIVSTSFGDIWVCSEKEARSQGFVKSPTCPH